jgi:hypothetical protein
MLQRWKRARGEQYSLVVHGGGNSCASAYANVEQCRTFYATNREKRVVRIVSVVRHLLLRAPSILCQACHLVH